MIDPRDPPEVQVEKQKKIIAALIRRAELGDEMGTSSYSLFNSAIALQGQVWAKTKDLERALHTLGRASNELESSREAQREVQRNLADAVEAMESGFALFTDGRLQICNQLFRNLLPDVSRRIKQGMHIDDYLESLFNSRFADDGKEAQQVLAEDVGNTPLKGNDQTSILAVKGDRWFQITRRETEFGNTVVLQTEVTRIIRRNRTERTKLIDSQAQFLQTAFDHMNFGVGTFSSDGVLIQANMRFFKLLGLPIWLSEKGSDLSQILHYIQSHKLLSGLEAPLSFGVLEREIEREADAEWKVRHVSGAVLDLNMHILPDGGRLITVRDTSAENQAKALLEQRVASRTQDLTQANDRLRAQNEELERIRQELQASKDEAEAAVSSKTRFLAAASHDLLQPINAAKLFLSTLTDATTDTALSPTVERLDRSFNSIEGLLHSLLDISRLESTGVEFNISRFPLQRLMRTVEADTAPLAEEKGIDLRIVPTSMCVESDQRYLTRSVQNLVLNAIQYTPKGKVLLGCRRQGNSAVIEVWDTGVGISQDDQIKIFEAFTRIDTLRKGQGMGLGLSIVDQACRQLGHKVELTSEPDRGSVFRIRLPLVPSFEMPEPLKREAGRTDDADMDLIVTVVENDPDVLLATSQRLEGWGASVLSAASTEEAVEHVRSIGIPPDILIVDYQLDGDDNGIKTIQTLRDMTRTHIPAIMITATRSGDLAQSASKDDFTVLTKPVQLARLRPLIDWKTRRSDIDKSIG